jgi:peptidoglycan/xylan/chitin deacetylase (PgdA/CDA1 family)
MYVGPLGSGDANTFVRGTDTLNDIKIRISPTAATAANVWVDAVIVPGTGRATHLITYDDCSVTWMNNVLPYLKSNGLRGTFGINIADIGTNANLYLNSSQIAEIAARGHQISPHNVTNTAYADGIGGTQNAAAYTGDFVTAQATLRGIIGNAMDATYHPWVQGRNNQAVHDTMRAAGLRLARGTDIGYNFPQVGLGNGAMALKIQSLNTVTTANIDTILDNAERYGLTVAWMVHEVTQSGGVGVETSIAVHRHLCEQLGARVQAARCAHRTASEFAREVYSEGLVANSLR